jgi:hypothetical protein
MNALPLSKSAPRMSRNMMCTVYFGGHRAMLKLKSGRSLVGVIVSTNFGTDLPGEQAELRGQAGLSAGRMYGDIHILPDIDPVMVLQALEIETVEPAKMPTQRSMKI